MGSTRNGRPVRFGAAARLGATAALAALSLLGGACTGDGGDGIEVVVGEIDGDAERESLANDNAYSAAGGRMLGAQHGGDWLDVEYFEALRKGDWVAPDHCWFSTRVSMNDTLVSEGFDGPTSDADREAGDGVLVGSLRTTIPVAADQPSQAPDLLPPKTTTTAETTTTADTTTTVEATTPPTDDADPGSAGGAGDDTRSDPTTTTFLDGPTTDEPQTDEPHVEEPATEMWTERDAVLAVAVVYGHDQVIELSSSDPSVMEGRGLDSQPLDGWNLVQVALDPATAPVDGVDVTLRRVREDGSETSEQLRIPFGGDGLDLLTEAWRFDLSAVDESCRVPGGDIANTPAAAETDILGSPVGEAPTLPAPGEQPADPTAAADQALASLRAVYDITDVYSTEKREHIEDPDAYDKIRTALIANDVVGPYMSNLDPQFRSAVFVSPTEAHILYRVGPSYQWEIGRVLLIDGRWRVAAGTFCRDLSAAGYTCPGVVKDPAPGPLG